VDGVSAAMVAWIKPCAQHADRAAQAVEARAASRSRPSCSATAAWSAVRGRRWRRAPS
jgi:hypothetical protein